MTLKFSEDGYGFNSTPGYTRRPITKFYVHVRLADVDRTLEWREVAARDLDEAINVAHRMLDVEVCLEASVFPGGVVT